MPVGVAHRCANGSMVGREQAVWVCVCPAVLGALVTGEASVPKVAAGEQRGAAAAAQDQHTRSTDLTEAHSL